MTNYSKTTNFTAKDSLVSGDANKIVKGSEIDAEFDNIATASATKANIASPAFTGVVSFPDGTAGDPSITNTGDTNTGLFFSAADTLAFSSAGTAQFTMTDGAIAPVTDNDVDLGTSSLEFKDGYFDGTLYTDAISLDGTAITSTAAEINILDGVTATAAELNILDGVTSTAAELNILDGVTSTASELNILDGVTSTTAELNILDGVTATTAELNIMDGVTATTAELNIMDGVTSTAVELNILDGVTSTAAELNILDGVTATTAELNYSDTGSSVGTVVASKVVTVDANKDVTSFRNITLTGELDAGSLDISGDADIDGTLETDALSINGTAVTATAAELNILDGVTSTAAELNILDGVTSTTAELNILDGVTSTAAELNILDGVTSTAAELNILDGVTSTTAELNILDGVTAVTGELNALDLGSTAVGIAIASKAVVLDSSKDFTGVRNFSITGDLSVAGTTTIVDSVQMTANNAVIFEGATADASETTLTSIDATADRTISLPDQSGTLPVLAAVSTTAITSTPEELNVLDGITAVVGELNALDLGSTAVGTAIASKAVILDSNKDYTGIRNFTISGELDAATLDISGDIDVDGTTNLDVVDIDGAVDMSAGLSVTGASSGSTVLTLTSNALADTSLMVFQRTGGAVAGKLAYEDGNTAMSFGTTTAHELKLLTNNTNRLEIDSSGNSTFSGNVTADGLTSSGAVTIDPADGVADDAYALTVRNNEATDGRNYGLWVRAGSNSSDESFSVRNHDNSATYFKVRGDGNVGIGTATISAPLTVNNNTDHSDIAIFHAGGGTPNRGLKISTFSNTNSNAGVELDAQSSTGAFKFSLGGSEAMRISGGSVGIGTSSPAKKLHIYDATQANQSIRFGNPAATPYGEINYDATGFEHLYIDSHGTTTGYGNIVFRTGSAPAEAMRIDSSGNVGIGVAPTAEGRLHVYKGGSGKSYSADAADQLILENSGSVMMDIRTPNGSTGGILFSDNDGRGRAVVQYAHSNDTMYFNTASAERMNLSHNGLVMSVAIKCGDVIASGSGGLSLQTDEGTKRIIIADSGAVSIPGSLSKGSGSFKIDHPLPAKKDTHHLVHSFVEAPQADNIYRGSVDLVGGSATVNIDTAAGMTDGTFVLLNTNVQCFTSNESGWTAIKGSVSGNTLTITAQDNTCTDTISWMVVGERHDQHMKDTDWTDSDGKVIVEPEKTSEGE